MWEENLGTQAGVRLIKGVQLIWRPLNTGFTVLRKETQRSENRLTLDFSFFCIFFVCTSINRKHVFASFQLCPSIPTQLYNKLAIFVMNLNL